MERSPGHRRAIAVGLSVAILVVAASAAAQAQDPTNPYATGEQAAKEHDLDTDATPIAKESNVWQQVGGALYPRDRSKQEGTELVAGSPTRFDQDFFAVAMRNQRLGLAGGSRCRATPERTDGESAAAWAERVSACERVPVVYGFSHPPNGDPTWSELTELPGADEPGYVGEIAWIDDDTALAVGGTGAYPRREHAREPGESWEDWLDRDPAGSARAWLYDSGSWRELTLPEDMRGLTALDFHRTRAVGFAGGLAQLWKWEGGQFTERFDSESPTVRFRNRKLFRSRVREIRIPPIENLFAYAVTSGCCEQNDLENFPRLLTYGETASTGPRWMANAFGYDPLDDAGGTDEGTTAGIRRVNHQQTMPDSFYSLVLNPSRFAANKATVSVLATPGGPERPAEPATIVSHSECAESGVKTLEVNKALAAIFSAGDTRTLSQAYAGTRTSLSTARLVSGDGDTGTATLSYSSSSPKPGASCEGSRGDAIPDWAVGELRSTRLEGLGARALVASTHLRPELEGQTVDTAPTAEGIVDGSYEPTNEERLGAYLASQHTLASSYALNALDVIEGAGTGWAVGDRGALLSLSEKRIETSAGLEPPPPRLGAARPARLSDREPYEASVPKPATEAGAVPALRTREVAVLDEPRLLPAGSPDPAQRRSGPVEDVQQIVMSRDGTEGWAIGASAAGAANSGDATTLSLFRYDGASWSRCDPLGVPGQVPPDPACAELAKLRRSVDSGGRPFPVKLLAAARVPYEHDTDPSNDDEFEIVAVGTPYLEKASFDRQATIVRYRDGAWGLEEQEVREEVKFNAVASQPPDVAFGGPDNGWIRHVNQLYRFDGESWRDCGLGTQACGADAIPADAPDEVSVSGMTSAGKRVYVFGKRNAPDRSFPLILHHEGGKGWRSDSGGDPGLGRTAPGSEVRPADLKQDVVDSLAVTPTAEGKYEGWAMGSFGGVVASTGAVPQVGGAPVGITADSLMRLEGGSWEPFADRGALADYLPARKLRAFGNSRTGHRQQVAFPSAAGGAGAALALRGTGLVFAFDSERERFELVPGRPSGMVSVGRSGGGGEIQALAPDGRGGFWVAERNDAEFAWHRNASQVQFLHYATHAPRETFSEVPHPLQGGSRHITSLAGGPDGTLWSATDSATLARYDRITGWETAQIPGWDPGRVVTRASEVNAVALGASGEGVAVGRAGRIAAISGDSVRLDSAAGRVCEVAAPVAPCGTSRDLRAAAVAPDGSAITGGDRLALLWRPAGGEFRAISRPEAPVGTQITGVAMPSPDRAWLSTDQGAVFAGTLSGGAWSWTLENLTGSGSLLALDANLEPIALRAIAVNAAGAGYAVGDRGLVLRRDGERWKRLRTPFLDELRSVTLAPGSGSALVGGRHGVLLTAAGDSVELVRHAEYFDQLKGGVGDRVGERSGPVTGVALIPGYEAGEVEAWAATQARGEGTNRLLHYASDPDDPLLDPSRRAEALPDAPAPRPGELSFAAFGKSECHFRENIACQEMLDMTSDYELLLRRTVAELGDRSGEPGGPEFALFTGDMTDSPNATQPGPAGEPVEPHPPLDPLNAKLRRWAEIAHDPLADEGLPLYGALGSKDLAATCVVHNPENLNCDYSSKESAKAGDNLAWRQETAKTWGDGSERENESGLSFDPLGDDPGAVRHDDPELSDPDGNGPLTATKVKAGGAPTHYAVDVHRAGEPVARLVFVDSSLRSLAAGDPVQQPLETNGGQLAWLERMICLEGTRTSSGEGRCTRGPHQHAIVVSTTPTYSYGPGALSDTATDSAALEAVLMRHRASVVVSGRLGWNGLYYALQPGLHTPCPGEGYPERPPKPGAALCESVSTQLPAGGPAAGAAQTAGGAQSDAEGAAGAKVSDLTDAAGGGEGILPFVVASGAGGKFGPDGKAERDAPEGYWHGYTVVRLSPSGDPRETIVEQRPVYDWVGLFASRKTIRPRQSLRLQGVGRGPIGYDSSGNTAAPHAAVDEISTAAVTHRYDLLAADPERPWLALRAQPEGLGDAAGEDCAPYVCLDPEIATIDPQGGQVKAGSGKHSGAYAIAMLSVAEKVATVPLYFETSPAFRAAPVVPPTPTPITSPISAPASPTQPPSPQIPTVSFPSAPVPPALVPPPPAPPASPPSPPVPPPVPPTDAGPSPLSLSFAPTGLIVAPTTSVIPPPAPPINPAPPGGARKEARQRQAASQSSGADGAGEGAEGGGDLADGPPEPKGTSSMTRHDSAYVRRPRTRPEPSFTAYRPTSDSSPWATGALYGGGVTLMAAVLALGWTHGRPTPRRRTPDVPAPAFSRARSRDRRFPR